MTHDRVSSYSHWINGQMVAGTSGRAGDVFNPSLGVVAARVAFANEADVDDRYGQDDRRKEGNPLSTYFTKSKNRPDAGENPHPAFFFQSFFLN